MRKSFASRIFILAAFYCFVFFVIVVMQFSSKGNFTLPSGAMSIRGRYLEPDAQTVLQAAESNPEKDGRAITGGAKVFFGGIEFNLKEEHGNGLILSSASGASMPVNPETMIIADNSARFGLPGGTALIFNSFDSARGPELQISAEFADNVSQITIPITPRRSSLIRDNGQIGILYNSSRYFFGSTGDELENSELVLSKGNAFISYRSRGKKQSFEPGNYIIAQAQNYESTLASWQEQSYAHWRQNAASLQNENDIIAYCAEALRQNNFPAAVSSIPADFINSSRHSYKSAGFVGGMGRAYSTFTAAEREKINLIARLSRERSPEVFKEERALDFLFSRGNIAAANDFIDTIINTGPEMIVSGYCAGLLEAYSDFKRWRPQGDNPVESLIEQILTAAGESLTIDTEKKLVYASNNGNHDLEYSIRLGKALINWAQAANNTEWASIGRSLVLSALINAGPGAGNLYNILSPGNYYPRAALLADNGLWAWTVSPSVNASYIEGNLNIAVSFPLNSSHYIIINGVRPFIKLRVHDMDWRTDSQFERYDSSGWVYYPQDQILILKLKHRATVENIRIIYVPEEIPEAVEDDTAAGEGEAL